MSNFEDLSETLASEAIKLKSPGKNFCPDAAVAGVRLSFAPVMNKLKFIDLAKLPMLP